MELLESIRAQAQRLSGEVVSWRRHFHAHPELSYQEHDTARYVASVLKSFGLEPTEGIAGTGVTVTIAGTDPSSAVVALRADMDALPIVEANDIPYASQEKGVMHACGHDAHTASLLGTAKILQDHRQQFKGTVKLIFQPGEEKNPGGASLMINEGVLHNPSPAGIIGQHVMPLLPVGKIGFREGMYMASSDEIYLTVVGKGGHAAAPELLIDPVAIAAQIIVALQQVISRNASPRQPTVLSFGKVIANGATNVVPDQVQIAGTFRAMNEKWREEGLARIKSTAEHIAEGMGARCEVVISKGYPYLENDPALTRRLRRAAEEFMGKENVVDIDLTLGSEDFAYYSQVIPACFYRLGTRNEQKGITSYIHTPTFNIDEEALGISTGLMAWLAIQELGVVR